MKFIWNQEKKNKVFFLFEEKLDICDSKIRKFFEENKIFSGKKDEIFDNLYNEQPAIYVGLGKEEELSIQVLRKQGKKLGTLLKKYKLDEVELLISSTSFPISQEAVLEGLVEGLLQSNYTFDRYKEKKEEPWDIEISIQGQESKKSRKVIDEISTLMEGVFLTRDLVNIPAMDMYPEVFGEKIDEVLTPLGVQVTILDKQQIADLKMEAFLSVAEGSDRDPRFILMEYKPVANEAPIALVGKGIMYDSGGYAIKPPRSMVTMKTDMAGAATVVGTIYALAKNKIQKNVIGVVAACENMISGRAYKNGDIVGSMKGLTIEIGNTDAEGRVTLADSLYYAATKTGAKKIIDLATLTGAAVVAVGEYTTALMTNDEEFCQVVKDSAEEAGEYVWELKANEELRDSVKGDFGDINNIGGGSGGSITAGIFLEHFVEELPWVHMDIAGPVYSKKAYSYLPKGATGIPVKTLYRTILNS
ncbi:MAG: leucyl aminopeptidase [Tissierellia bacterium]|nr:leucyl aminopeptidase [Tissierellia bacterium]